MTRSTRRGDWPQLEDASKPIDAASRPADETPDASSAQNRRRPIPATPTECSSSDSFPLNARVSQVCRFYCCLRFGLRSFGHGKTYAIAHWNTLDRCDIGIFAHWKEIIQPLSSHLQKCEGTRRWLWRDPSDERISINSFILLASDGSDQHAIRRVRYSDWIRLADAEEPGELLPYNADFIEQTISGVFYDRFMPHEDSIPYLATRHVFGGNHYSCVTAGSFAKNVLQSHFRRHYTQLSLVARFEQAALLAISSRLSQAVEAFSGEKGDRSRLEREILDIQDQFLQFVHRYRFTGISSQTQGAEMFTHWRESLGLDRLFEEVQQEVEAAAASVRARQQERETLAATELNVLAAVGVVLGLVAALMGANLLVQDSSYLPFAVSTPLVSIGRIFAVVLLMMGAFSLVGGALMHDRKRVKWLYWGAFAAGLVLFAVLFPGWDWVTAMVGGPMAAD